MTAPILPPLESALLVLVPEAEVLVESFRRRYDPAAALGVPAHVTVLYPFKPPGELSAEVMETLTELFARVPSFTAEFAQARQFPGVLYLAPQPAEPFRRLTELIHQHFPETPPYGGQFAEVIPHLTVAQVSDSEQLQHITADFESVTPQFLPLQTQVKAVTLMHNESGAWQNRWRFALGG